MFFGVIFFYLLFYPIFTSSVSCPGGEWSFELLIIEMAIVRRIKQGGGGGGGIAFYYEISKSIGSAVCGFIGPIMRFPLQKDLKRVKLFIWSEAS